MSIASKVIVVVVLLAAIGGVLVLKSQQKSEQPEAVAATEPRSSEVPQPTTPRAVVSEQPARRLPLLMDLGANKCIPCKAMKPILDELKSTYAGRFNVEFVDVWENPAKAKEYGIEIIPTQIFFDASGKELFRHQGFFGREEMLAKWKELGVDISGAGI